MKHQITFILDTCSVNFIPSLESSKINNSEENVKKLNLKMKQKILLRINFKPD